MLGCKLSLATLLNSSPYWLNLGRVVSSSCSKHTGEECVGPQDCLQAYCRVLSKGLKSSISSNFRRKVLETWWWPAEVCNRT
eukprot:scaffold187185_cov26-Tisochrysis_lutea.AAC.1